MHAPSPHLATGKSGANGSQDGVKYRTSARPGRVHKDCLPPVVTVQQPGVILSQEIRIWQEEELTY